ncbi:uncharacterized protein LOC134838551 [Culicoides brevitarsis]|uniref:uncharacterized protein LOC134838551 n=1 Tax=Culicoides brevitarsis TaxID=469753 RepID=UPI00307BAE95
MTNEESFNGQLLNSVWQVCEKVRKVLEKEGFALSYLFRNYDPRGTGLVEESQFFTVLMKNLRGILTLDELEIKLLSNYFKLRNGKIHYKQFCDVMEGFPNEVLEDVSKNCTDQRGSVEKNTLSNFENHHICLLLTKIAHSVRLREVALKPYFEDYEVIAKNNGTVTFSHLYRLLHFLGIELSNKDFQILVKKYIQDSYTINYENFVKDIETYVCFFDRNRPSSYEQDVAQNYPGKFIEVKIPSINRSEVETGNWIFGRPSTCHPSVTSHFYRRNRAFIDLNTIFESIQKHIVSNKINMVEYFRQFDSFLHGCVTKSQFKRVLEAIGISGLNRIYWSEEEIERLCEVFAKEENPELVNWKLFKNEIECGYSKGNCSLPPLKEITQEDIVNEIKCQNIESKIQKNLNERSFSLEPFFKDFDR